MMRAFALAAALLMVAPLGAADGQPPPPRPHHGPGWHHDVPRHGWRHRGHRTCRTVWRHHHRERRCFYR